MRKSGLVGRCPRRFRRTTIPDPSTQVQDLVQRQFRPAAPNQLWCADISYIRTWAGWLYLAVILDAYSRKVVGWVLAEHMRTELVTAALQMASTRRRPPTGLVCHSDRGSQYTSSTYGDILDRSGARQSIGRPGTCWDNAVAESFFATLKKELIYPHVWPTSELRAGSHLQLHRKLVQPGAPPFDTQLLQPDHIRGALLSFEHSRLIVLTNPSVKTGQHQLAS
jgi:transposase InsO family protein